MLPVFDAAFDVGATYLDMAMSLSRLHPDRPYENAGVKLGDEQFARAEAWAEAGRLALVGIGVEPGLSDVFARHAADALFERIDEIGVRDGADLVVEGFDFAPSFSIWTTIEECLNPPIVWEKSRGWFTTEPFSEPEVFVFPEGIGPVECVNVEHEEVVLVPRWIDCERVTFKYGLGDEFIDVLKTLRKLGLDRTEELRVGEVGVAPRDVVAAALPDPMTLGDRMTGKTCAGTWVTGTGADGSPREVYLHHVVDNEETWGGTARRPSCGRRRSTPSSRWSSSRRARGRARASSVPRRSRRAVPRPPDGARIPVGLRGSDAERCPARSTADGPGERLPLP